MITLIFILVAAIAKAISDTLWHHFETSIFKKLNPKWWNPNVSWEYVKLIVKYRPDAWHLSNSFMIVAFIFSCVFYENWIWNKWSDLVVYGLAFNACFNILYNHILRKK